MDRLETTTIRHEGFRFQYRVHPQRRRRTGRDDARPAPVLFLGGAFQTMESWDRFVTAFEDRTDVLLVDLPGSGGADPLPASFGLDFLADALRTALDAAEVTRVNLVAASYASPVAYLFAQRHPERISTLALAGIMRSIPDDLRERIEQSVEHAMDGALDLLADATIEGLLCQDPTKCVMKRGLASRVLRAGITRLSDADRLRYALNTLRLLRHEPLRLSTPPRVPCLVFTGEHDVFTTPEACREIADSIPGARFTTIEHADHLFHVERFERTVELLIDFVLGAFRPVASTSSFSASASAVPAI